MFGASHRRTGMDGRRTIRRLGLETWLNEVEVRPREMKERKEGLYFNSNLARAVLMCYNAADATRDGRSDSRLVIVMYQGLMDKKGLGNGHGEGRGS